MVYLAPAKGKGIMNALETEIMFHADDIVRGLQSALKDADNTSGIIILKLIEQSATLSRNMQEAFRAISKDREANQCKQS